MVYSPASFLPLLGLEPIIRAKTARTIYTLGAEFPCFINQLYGCFRRSDKQLAAGRSKIIRSEPDILGCHGPEIGFERPFRRRGDYSFTPAPRQ